MAPLPALCGKAAPLDRCGQTENVQRGRIAGLKWTPCCAVAAGLENRPPAIKRMAKCRLFPFFDLNLVEAGRTRRPKQADADDGLAGLRRNRERAAFFVPTGGAQEWADVQPCDLLALVVIQRDGDVWLLIQILLPAHH